MFASDLDAASKAQLARGERMVELLKQPQSSPMNVEEQVAVVWAGTNGHLDDVPVEDVRRFESEYLDFLRREHSGLFSSIVESGKLSEDAEGELESSMTAFKKQFAPSDDAGIRPGSDEADENTPELGDGDVNQERIVKAKR